MSVKLVVFDNNIFLSLQFVVCIVVVVIDLLSCSVVVCGVAVFAVVRYLRIVLLCDSEYVELQCLSRFGALDLIDGEF